MARSSPCRCIFSPALAGVALLGMGIMIRDGQAPIIGLRRRLYPRDETIKLWKLQTMIPESSLSNEEREELRLGELRELKISGKDPRITKFGGFLRKTSLDEIPQLYNIGREELSFVGPRLLNGEEWHQQIEPNIPKDPYKTFVRGMDKGVKYGLTGMYGIFGRSDLTYEKRVELDAHYIEKANLAADLKILAWTIPAVLSRKGAY